MIYAVWISGPYLRSIVIRDAAVTTWITSARTPIAGLVEYAPHHAGERIGRDRRIAVVSNPRASPLDMLGIQTQLDRTAAELAALEARVNALKTIVAERTAAALAYAQAYSADVAADVANHRARITYHRDAMALEVTEADRLASMRDSGASSQSQADAAQVAVIDRKRVLLEAETNLLRAEQRLAAAAAGAFLGLADSGDGGDGQRSLDDAKMALEQAQAGLAPLQTEIAALTQAAEATRAVYERTSAATILAAEDAMVWSLIAGIGAEVQAGAVIATWVDCRVLLVDAPVSDLEVALLSPGAPAEVTFEGDDRVRDGTVLFTRGAAATLGGDDLAAVAKGRGPNTGQVIIELSPDEADIAACPIGRSAFVNFPGVGVIDMLAARLRL
ncbi:MAG: HlyD family efflux transporter periplasmic adaptor subunit [Dongiaceae bacterium]